MKEITGTFKACEICDALQPSRDVECTICKKSGCYNCMPNTFLGYLCRKCRQHFDSRRCRANLQRFKDRRYDVVSEEVAEYKKQKLKELTKTIQNNRKNETH